MTVPATFAQDHVVQIDKDEISVEILAERVQQALLEREDKSRVHPRRRRGRLQDIVSVMDRLKEAGVEKVGLIHASRGTK